MLLDFDALAAKYRMTEAHTYGPAVRGVVHCGAHEAEERETYNRVFGPDIPVWWIEANPQMEATIRANLEPYPNQHLIMALLADTDGEDMALHISGPEYAGSSSVLEWGSHKEFSPLRWVDHVWLKTRTLDSLWEEHDHFDGANLVVTDLQGLDGLVLSAGMSLLEQTEFVMCEVNRAQVYKGCMEVDALNAMLAAVDPGPPFVPVETYWEGTQNWGDQLLVREYRR